MDMQKEYIVTSNRESGFGRYDIILEPLSQNDDAIIIEFKVRKKRENSLEETLQNALGDHCRRQPQEEQLHPAEKGLAGKRQTEPAQRIEQQEVDVQVEIRQLLHAKAHHLAQNQGIIVGGIVHGAAEPCNQQHGGGQRKAQRPRGFA